MGDSDHLERIQHLTHELHQFCDRPQTHYATDQQEAVEGDTQSSDIECTCIKKLRQHPPVIDNENRVATVEDLDTVNIPGDMEAASANILLPSIERDDSDDGEPERAPLLSPSPSPSNSLEENPVDSIESPSPERQILLAETRQTQSVFRPGPLVKKYYDTAGLTVAQMRAGIQDADVAQMRAHPPHQTIGPFYQNGGISQPSQPTYIANNGQTASSFHSYTGTGQYSRQPPGFIPSYQGPHPAVNHGMQSYTHPPVINNQPMNPMAQGQGVQRPLYPNYSNDYVSNGSGSFPWPPPVSSQSGIPVPPPSAIFTNSLHQNFAGPIPRSWQGAVPMPTSAAFNATPYHQVGMQQVFMSRTNPQGFYIGQQLYVPEQSAAKQYEFVIEDKDEILRNSKKATYQGKQSLRKSTTVNIKSEDDNPQNDISLNVVYQNPQTAEVEVQQNESSRDQPKSETLASVSVLTIDEGRPSTETSPSNSSLDTNPPNSADMDKLDLRGGSLIDNSLNSLSEDIQGFGLDDPFQIHCDYQDPIVHHDWDNFDAFLESAWLEHRNAPIPDDSMETSSELEAEQTHLSVSGQKKRSFVEEGPSNVTVNEKGGGKRKGTKRRKFKKESA